MLSPVFVVFLFLILCGVGLTVLVMKVNEVRATLPQKAEKKVTSKKKLARERRQLAQLGPVEA